MIKASRAKTDEHLRYTNTHSCCKSESPFFSCLIKLGDMHILWDGVGENGSHDFQMEGLKLRELEQLNSALGFHAEPNKVSLQRAEAWISEGGGVGGRWWPIIAQNHLPEICTGAALNSISHSSSSHCSISWKRSNIPHTKRCCRSLLITLCCHSNG